MTAWKSRPVAAHETASKASDDAAHDTRQLDHVDVDAWWASCCDAAITAAAATGLPFQAHDLTQPPYGLTEPSNPNFWGARFHIAARSGLIRSVGAAPSRRPTTAGSLVRVWQGVDHDRCAAA